MIASPLPPAARLALPHPGLLRHRSLPALLQAASAGCVLFSGRAASRQPHLDAVLVWGRKPSARRGERLAQRRTLPLWRCEDAFLRSLRPGPEDPPLGLVLDDQGLYYDASGPSRLEALVVRDRTPSERERAEALIRLWRQERVSKYNGAPETPAPEAPFVLVVDQTAGDLAIRCGLAGPERFAAMLAAALEHHPDCRVLVKTHPEVAAGRRQGHFSAAQLSHPRILLDTSGGHPTALLERAEAVYVVTSQLGFEALLWGRPVHCFGMPFYAGWGLTHDSLQAPERRRQLRSLRAPTLADLAHAALCDYAVYIDPHQQGSCSVETLVSSIGLQRRRRQELPSPIEAFGFTPWKQRVLRRFLAGSTLRFRFPWQLPAAEAAMVAIWGRRARPALLQSCRRRDIPLLHVEDGFLRSVGLGADLIDPLSWVIDASGIYYDATASSDLEQRLARGRWSDQQRHRAERLRRRLVEQQITKYNLQAPAWSRPPAAARVVLVVGQVESDASIRYGAPRIRSNLELLQAVRRAEPEAYLLYKPHPDVVAGVCRRGAGEERAQAFCDEVLVQASMQQLFDQIDALHVLTSLAGFEALLRGVEVHTWGLPFYAGWGLSHDRLDCERRGRALQLSELVHAALIEYPRYVSRHSGLFIEPEQAVEELLAWRAQPGRSLQLWQRIFRHWGRWRRR